MDARWLETQFKAHPEKTKAGLARALGLEPPAISKILSGTRQIKASEYVGMRAFFGLPSDGARAASNSNAYVLAPLNDRQHFNEDADHQGEWVIPADIVQRHTTAPSEHIKSFRVGDNMMVPDFRRDEHVLVDLSDILPSPPGTFVVSDGFGYLLRNCAFVPNSKPAQIEITALQSNFQPQILNKDEFKILGRVIAKLQWL